MTEKIKLISNPLTIIAIFAALAEINATVSIGLVDKELQSIFIWFVIGFPTMIVTMFFITLNFNTKVVYAPSDYKDDSAFHRMLIGEQLKPDKDINLDSDIIRRTLDELGIKERPSTQDVLNVSTDVTYLFSVRYLIEKEVRRLANNHGQEKRARPVFHLLAHLVEQEIITPNQHKAIRNLYSITSPAVHGEDQNVTLTELDFVKQVSPGLINELQNIQ